MKDSRKVFDAIEDYVKGKKSVSRDQQRKESVKIALDALAIVAENGDAVAKAIAQILIDRFNQVRRTGPEDPNHSKLADYGKNVAAGLSSRQKSRTMLIRSEIFSEKISHTANTFVQPDRGFCPALFLAKIIR